MGPQAEQIFNSFTFAAEGDKDDPAKVMENFDSHFVPKRNVIFERQSSTKDVKRQEKTSKHTSVPCLTWLSTVSMVTRKRILSETE